MTTNTCIKVRLVSRSFWQMIVSARSGISKRTCDVRRQRRVCEVGDSQVSEVAVTVDAEKYDCEKKVV